MTTADIHQGFSRVSQTLLFKLLIIMAISYFLASCSDEPARTEAEYISIATEAHASGNSRGALFELGTAISHYPKSPQLQILRATIFLDLEDGTAAEIAYNKALSLGYNPEFVKYELAQAWLYQREPAKVIDRLEKEIQQGTKDPHVFEIVSKAYMALRDHTNPAQFRDNMTKAENYINEAYRINPESTRVLNTKAWVAAIYGNLDEAIEWLNKSDAIIKDQRENLAIKGELLVRKKETAQAHEIYKKLVQKYPQYPQYKMELGYTYILDKDFAEARKLIAPIVEQYPNHLRARYLLANVALMENNYEEAKNLTDSILAKSPEYLNALIVNGASSYFLNDLENAHQKLVQFYGKTGSIPGLKLLAATKLKLGENAEAEQLLKDAGQSSAVYSDAELLNLVAIASTRVGKTEAALQAYKTLSETSPAENSFKQNMAMLQISRGEFETGFKNLESALAEENAETEPGQDLYTLASRALQVKQYDRASQYIEQYKQVAPKSYKPWVMSAVLNSTRRNSSEARKDFEKASELAPDIAEVKTRYAIFEKIQGNEEKAQQLAAEALKLDPSDIGAGQIIIEELVKQQKEDDIKKLIDNVIAHEKSPAYSKLFFADYYTMLGRPQDTLGILSNLPKELHKSTTYQIVSAKAYLRNGQSQRAVSILETVAQVTPNNITVLKHLLQGYLLIKDQTKYQSTLEKIDTLRPNDFTNQMELTQLYISTAKYDLATKMLADIKPENENQTLQKRILQSSMEMNRGNFKTAQTLLSPLYKQYPQNGAINMLYARSLANDNQNDEAILVSKKWADRHPDNLEVKNFLADLYMRSNDNDNARRLYNEILTSDQKPSSRMVMHSHNNLAIIYLNQDQGEKALEHAQKAFDMAPNVAAIVDTFAQALMAQGQAEKAIDHFNQALALLPSNDKENKALFTLGKAKALIKAGNSDQAKKLLNRLVKDNPDFDKISEAKQLLAEM